MALSRQAFLDKLIDGISSGKNRNIGLALDDLCNLMGHYLDVLCILFPGEQKTWFINRRGLRYETMHHINLTHAISSFPSSTTGAKGATRKNRLQYVYRELRTTAYIPLYYGDTLFGYILFWWKIPVTLSAEDEKFLKQTATLIGLWSSTGILYYRSKGYKTDLKEIYQTLIQRHEAERKQVSRELHDSIGQTLTSIMMQLKSLKKEFLCYELPSTLAERLEGIHQNTGDALQEVRRISTGLRPTILMQLGVMPAIRWYLQEYSDTSSLEINFECDNMQDRLNEGIELLLFRAVQECLTNVTRHAEASHVHITLTGSKTKYTLTVKDNGKGMKIPPPREGIGIIGMRERTELLGGRMEIFSRIGIGTSVSISVPIKKRGSRK